MAQENEKTNKFHKEPMLSTLVFVTFMPLQVSPTGQSTVPLSRPLAVSAYVDTAKILGLPKFKLRDSKGNLYSPYKVMMQEPSAIVLQHAGMPMVSDITMRKAYIQSYVKR